MYMIVPNVDGQPGTTPTHEILMLGGCQSVFVDTKKDVPPGEYFKGGYTEDTEERRSVTDYVPMTVQKAAPKNATGWK
jgi:hypothetical protein